MKILVFGGTFNPVHNGHVRLCRILSEKVQSDLTVVVPTFKPVHKTVDESLIDSKHRLRMCEIAFDDERTVVSDIEIAQNRPCYTCDTLKMIHNKYPCAELYLACGSDMFVTLHEWKNPSKIYKLSTICAISRKERFAELEAYASEQKRFGMKSILCDVPPMEVSSTEIRSMIKNHEDISALVPTDVIKYIKDNGLYL